MIIPILLCLSLGVFGYTVAYMLLNNVYGKRLLVEARVSEMAQGVKEKEKQKRKRDGKKSVLNMKLSDKFRQDMELSGMQMKPEEYMFIWIFVALAPAALAFVLTGSILRAVAIMAAGIFLPGLVIRSKINGQKKIFELQLGDALIIIANGLRAGFSFPQALLNVANNMTDPVRKEFRNAAREISVGVDIETALSEVADRMESPDLRLLITAVVIQQQVGGNLADILETISSTIRDRMKIKRTVKTLTAQGRISGYVIGALPILILIGVSIFTPGYMEPLFSTMIGNVILGISALLEGCGFLVINKIIDIKF